MLACHNFFKWGGCAGPVLSLLKRGCLLDAYCLGIIPTHGAPWESGVQEWHSVFPSLPTPQELEKCDANHYIILFRDAGCQFRALYCYQPDTEEIYKLTGTGPKSITKKMIDKLYKYSSDRKQFNLIPAKTMSVSVDALTIHNHLWQPKRPTVPKKTQTRK